MNTKKIAVAMSGGIDSSITALILKEQGYTIVGITLRVWDYLSEGCTAKETGCCSMESIFEARDFAESIGAEHYIVDVREQFKATVVQDFINEYKEARTPNPCVVCNPAIKWNGVLEKAIELGCTHIATGHYSQIASENGRYFVTRAADITKDQSYVLWNLSQEQLSKTLLPLGKYKKSEIKDLASERGFQKLAKKRESQEICFIPDDDYRKFLRNRLPNLDQEVQGGVFKTTDGKIVGTHEGYPFYTIGQRKGLRVALGKPMYVAHIDKNTNTITLGEKHELTTSTMQVHRLNFMKYESFTGLTNVMVKIRYNSMPVDCSVRAINNEIIEVTFTEPIASVTPGQSAVFYEHNDVIAGGIIL